MKRVRRTENLISTNGPLFYILSFTYGLPMTLIGCVGALFMLVTLHKPFVFERCLCFRVGRYSGCSLGIFIFIGGEFKEELLVHEFGHSVQNCLYGPLMPFVVALPSFVRFHYRRIKKFVFHQRLTSDYESIWFEKEATALGKDYLLRLSKRNTK